METYQSSFTAVSSQLNTGPCSQCKWRKVRCDRRLTTCGNCTRLGLTCSLPLPLTTRENDSRPIERPRLRGTRACIKCREKKVRCSEDMPQCGYCQRQALPCSYPPLKRPRRRSETNDTTAARRRVVESEQNERAIGRNANLGAMIASEMMDLVDTFFDTIYPLPSYAFLHPETTKKRCREGHSHKPLKFAICAIASLYTGCRRELASQWVQDAEQSIWQHLECPTVPRLQTLLLVIHHQMESRRFERAFMLTATAARFASAMRLNHERPELDPVAREVRRRIVWSLKIVEKYFYVGLPQFELCPFESIFIDFPLPEERFCPEHVGEHGAYSLLVRLESVRRDIIKLTRTVVASEEPQPSLTNLIQHHKKSLSEIGTLMPNGPMLSLGEIPGLLESPWLPRHLLLHISWHQAHCDLNRILVRGYLDAAPVLVLDALPSEDLIAAEGECLRHVTSIIQLFTTLNQLSTSCCLLELDTAICVYQASRLLSFISWFGRHPERPSPEFAASRVDLCITALRRFFPSTLVSLIIEELERISREFSKQVRVHQEERQLQKRYRIAPTTVVNQTPSSPTLVESLGIESRSGLAVRERLAIHSLLRLASFSFGEEDEPQDESSKDHQQHPAVTGRIDQARAVSSTLAVSALGHCDTTGSENDSTVQIIPPLSTETEISNSLDLDLNIGEIDWDTDGGHESGNRDYEMEIEETHVSSISYSEDQGDWDPSLLSMFSVPFH